MSKLNLLVCPHDTAKNPERWFRFVQYLNHKLTAISEVQLHFDLSIDFNDFHGKMDKADLVYANPADTAKFLEKNFVSLVRPSNLYDEVVFISSSDHSVLNLSSLNGIPVASVATMLATKVGLIALSE
jgi:hypothetical protein